MSRTGIGVLDPGRCATAQELGFLYGDAQGNREGLNRYLVHLIKQAIGGQPPEGPQYRNCSFFKCGYSLRLPRHHRRNGMVTDSIRPAELPNPETLTETVNDCPVDRRPGLHETFRGELSTALHLLIPFLFRRYQKKRRGGGFLRGHLFKQ